MFERERSSVGMFGAQRKWRESIERSTKFGAYLGQISRGESWAGEPCYLSATELQLPELLLQRCGYAS